MIDTQPSDTWQETCVSGAAKTLSASGVAQTLFTVSGGPILIIALVGIVTTAIQNQACTLTYKITDTLSTTTTSISGATTVTNLLLGQVIALPAATLATAGLVATGGVIEQTVADLIICPAGTITVTPNATNTGAVQYYLRYKQLSTSSTVVAN